MISVIILTYNEEIHLERCLKSIKKITNSIFIIDSFSTDKTIQIAKKYNAKIYKKKFLNQSSQMNWALSSINFKTSWIMRVDADEYLSENLINEINKKLKYLHANIGGVILKRGHFFMGKLLKWGGRYPLYMLRIWRKNHAKCEKLLMDEHMILNKGQSVMFDNFFYDHNLKGLNHFIEKHNNYSSREAMQLLINDNIYKIKNSLDKKNKLKRLIKNKFFYKIPFSPFFYFCFRYFLMLGFLDGKEGFAYHFLQALWYRSLINLKKEELK